VADAPVAVADVRVAARVAVALPAAAELRT